MQKLLTFVFLSILLGCALSANSNKTKGELIQIVHPDAIGLGLNASSDPVIIPNKVSWAFDENIATTSKSNKPYVKFYRDHFYGEDFYKFTDSGTWQIRHHIFEIRRFYNHDSLASSISFQIEVSHDRSLLRVKPVALKIDKTKVRLRKEDKDLDLKINISIRGYWSDQSQTMRNNKVADIDLELKGLLVGKKYELKTMDDASYLATDGHRLSKKNPFSDWFAPIPISRDANGDFLSNSFGNYSIAVEVTEIDNFGKRVEKIGKGIRTLSKAVK